MFYCEINTETVKDFREDEIEAISLMEQLSHNGLRRIKNWMHWFAPSTSDAIIGYNVTLVGAMTSPFRVLKFHIDMLHKPHGICGVYE
ncbi:hypothetical protein VNO80_24291 [Phaseolus coccineus]|uniref:Uncharacterized protein n=1 Tax=Phaseolus coccineus TaxID=3886 RepID=A0AAN9LVR7_PHACN